MGKEAICPKVYIAEVIFKAEASTGEGAIWHPERSSLFWVDIEGKKLYEFLPREKDCREWSFDRMATTVVPESRDTLIVALQNEIIRINIETNERTSIAKIDDLNGTVRCNDGKCDPEGRFWIGTIAKKAPAGSAVLYTVSKDGKVVPRLTGVTNSNGLVWSEDKKYMYYNDTPTREIARFRYDPATGNIQRDGIAVKIEENHGKPDGMTIDKNGHLWVAQWGGHGVYCYNPITGKLLAKVDMWVPNITSCAFGGEQLDTLYITTARSGLSEEDLQRFPESGSLYVCKPDARGVKANYFTK
ncbi:MAG: SMP-30/gluconolactonase/LRE family protein [Tannerellaceae bacterium]|nr:SMP-30/gluconolactonase/LRE family protein [Tannerellaceae bacterium]